jgi:hypothetical protein
MRVNIDDPPLPCGCPPHAVHILDLAEACRVDIDDVVEADTDLGVLIVLQNDRRSAPRLRSARFSIQCIHGELGRTR